MVEPSNDPGTLPKKEDSLDFIERGYNVSTGIEDNHEDAKGHNWKRVSELLFSFGLLVVSFLVILMNQHYSQMPDVSITVTSATSTTYDIPSSDSSYPVFLDGVWCSASELNASSGYCFDAKEAGMRAEMQVPTWAVVVFGPMFTGFILLVQNYRMYGFSPIVDKRSHSVWDLQGRLRPFRDVMVGLVLAIAISNLITNLLKNMVGRPRPNALALLALDEEHYKKDAYRSFPSGHAAGAMSGLYFLSLWLRCIATHARSGAGSGAGSGISPNTGDDKDTKWKGLQSIALSFAHYVPTAVAIWVAATRVQDYWHHYSDITAGMIVGAASATYGFSYCSSHITISNDNTEIDQSSAELSQWDADANADAVARRSKARKGVLASSSPSPV